MTTDKCCLWVNEVMATNTTGDALGKARASADDTADIVGMSRVVVVVSKCYGVCKAAVHRIYLASLGLVTLNSELLESDESAAIDITTSLEVVCVRKCTC